MIDQFDTSSAFGTNIQADIRKAFDGSLLEMKEVPMNEEPMIVYDETALSQISNITINRAVQYTFNPNSSSSSTASKSVRYGYVNYADEQSMSSQVRIFSYLDPTSENEGVSETTDSANTEQVVKKAAKPRKVKQLVK